MFTSVFGLTERHRNGEWGWPGIHIGVDRGPVGFGEPTGGIWSPLYFSSSKFEDWHGKVYGTLIKLKHVAGFEVCIAHCDREEIAVLPRLMQGLGIGLGELIGVAGSNGVSYGKNARHTHTEIRSYGDRCQVLEDVLAMRYGEAVQHGLTERQILHEYHASHRTRDWGRHRCLEDYGTMIQQWGIVFINEYKIVRRRQGEYVTYYSSQRALLF